MEEFLSDVIRFASWQSANYTQETMMINGMDTDHIRGCIYQNKEIISGRIKNTDGLRVYNVDGYYIIRKEE